MSEEKGRTKSILVELMESMSSKSAKLLSIYVTEPSVDSLSRGFELIKRGALDEITKACS